MAWVAPVVGGVSSILGGITGGKGASAAAKAQAQAQANALAEQQREFNVTQQNYAPYLAAGTSALGAQGNLLGLNGTGAQQSAITSLQGSPLFTSLDKSGTDALLQAAAATGGLRGGNTESALFNNRSQLLANVIQNQLAGLSGVSALGANSAQSLGTAGQNNANAISGIYQQQGNAGAAGAYGQSINQNKTITDLTGIIQKTLGGLGGGVDSTTAQGFANYGTNIAGGSGYGISPNLSDIVSASLGSYAPVGARW